MRKKVKLKNSAAADQLGKYRLGFFYGAQTPWTLIDKTASEPKLQKRPFKIRVPKKNKKK